MLITISSSLIKFEILSRSVDNLGEKNAFSTSTMNLQPLSLYSVSVLSSPASILTGRLGLISASVVAFVLV